MRKWGPFLKSAQMETRKQLHASATLSLNKRDPHYRMKNRLGEPQSGSGRCRLEENDLSLLGIEPRPSSSVVRRSID
jgi:hypothetical protein